ncbi:unnamed protein product, partial [marine sediment metagenome]
EILVLTGMLWLASRTFAGGLAGFGLRRHRLSRDLLWAVVGYLMLFPFCMVLVETTVWLLVNLRPTLQLPEHDIAVLLRQGQLSWVIQCLLWLMTCLLVPAFEEVFFRGLFQSWIRSATGMVWLPIILSGVMFALVHQPYWQFVPALAALGIALGYAYERTGSLRLVIIFHCIFNLRTLLLLGLVS